MGKKNRVKKRTLYYLYSIILITLISLLYFGVYTFTSLYILETIIL